MATSTTSTILLPAMRFLCLASFLGLYLWSTDASSMSLEKHNILSEDEENFTETELAVIKHEITWPEIAYIPTLDNKTIAQLHQEGLMAGRYNVEGRVLAVSKCLSGCSAEVSCAAVCVPGLIISTVGKTTRKDGEIPHFTGHDIKPPHEMILFIYQRGRRTVPSPSDFAIGDTYRFSISKNPYHAELLGYEVIR